MLPKRVTIWFLIVTGVLLILWDIYVASNGVDGDTISEVTLGFAQKHPFIPFAAGVIGGHLFWPQKSVK